MAPKFLPGLLVVCWSVSVVSPAWAASHYTDAMFREAVGLDSTAPEYILITVRDARKADASRTVCVPSYALLAACATEHHLSPENGRKQALRFALDASDHAYTFTNPAALAQVTPRYTPAILREMRARMNAQLHLPSVTSGELGWVCRVGKGQDFGAYRDAAAHVLLEHGIPCEMGDRTGRLRLP